MFTEFVSCCRMKEVSAIKLSICATEGRGGVTDLSNHLKTAVCRRAKAM